MEKFMLMAHSGWRYVVLLMVLLAIIYGFYGMLNKLNWNPTARKILLFTTIAVDIQFLLGLILYLVRKGWEAQWGAGSRFEHPFFMLLALIFMHVVSSRIKGLSNDRSRYQTMALGAIMVVLLVVGGIIRLTNGGPARLFGMS